MANFIIAIDGTAASGKGTLARRLSEHYGLSYLDTGLTYRAVAYNLLQQAESLENEKAILQAAQRLELHSLDAKVLSAPHIGEAASKIAIYPALRNMLVKAQKQFAQQSEGAVLDGRDIGTIVCPNANIKLYIDADIEIRAARRLSQLNEQQKTADLATIRQALQNRDERDKARPVGALKKAEDAFVIDNSQLTIEQSFHHAKEIIDPVINACFAAKKDIYRGN